MRVVINVLALIAAFIGFVALCLIVWGWGSGSFNGSGGMALVGFQFWAAIGCIAALVLGIIGYVLARSAERDYDAASDIGVGIGLTGIVLFLLMRLFS